MPSWKELKRYCDRDGWENYKTTDHFFYRKVLPNGEVLHTKVSNSSAQIGPALWRKILNNQLCTSQEHFDDVI